MQAPVLPCGVALATSIFYTVNPVKAAAININQSATISGSTITPGDVLTITVTDSSLSSPESISYTVQPGDSTTSIATGLTSNINGDSTLSGLGVTATSSGAVITITSSSSNQTSYSQSVSSGATESISLSGGSGAPGFISPSTAFTGSPVLVAGANTAMVTARSGGGTPTTNSYPITINSATSQSFTYDSNGNMTSDGTNSYAWDAADRLIKITYPGSGNNTQFTYDPMGRCAKIVETTASTVTSTKQFVWCGSERCEVRDGSSNLLNQYFDGGQVNFSGGVGTNFYFTADHLGSIREMTDAYGSIQAQYDYDPYGQATKLAGSGATPDFGYAGMYLHSRSGLNLTLFRQYHPMLGRWLSRDPLGEDAGLNLYTYIDSDPLGDTDPLGLDPEIGVTLKGGVEFTAARSSVRAVKSTRGVYRLSNPGAKGHYVGSGPYKRMKQSMKIRKMTNGAFVPCSGGTQASFDKEARIMTKMGGLSAKNGPVNPELPFNRISPPGTRVPKFGGLPFAGSATSVFDGLGGPFLSDYVWRTAYPEDYRVEW